VSEQLQDLIAQGQVYRYTLRYAYGTYVATIEDIEGDEAQSEDNAIDSAVRRWCDDREDIDKNEANYRAGIDAEYLTTRGV